MTTPGESYSNPNTEQVLANTLEQVRSALRADLAQTLLPEGTTLLGVRTELYQSPTLALGRVVMPTDYAPDDRSLIILTLQEGKQVFHIAGKINPRDPFDINNALGGGVDPREINLTTYAYDGDQTITEYLQDGKVYSYTGEDGDPEMLLHYIRERLGIFVASESLGVDPSA